MQNSKIKEPAPVEEVASPKTNDSISNDTTEKQKCQERIDDAISEMLKIYGDLSKRERVAWSMGSTYRRLLDVKHLLEDKQ